LFACAQIQYARGVKHVLFGSLAGLALLAGAAPAEAPRAPAPAAAPIEAPRGMVAFFDAAGCPEGWLPDALAAGRLLIATDEVVAVGRVVGTPLAPEEDRVHDHTIAGATVDLPYKSISAGDGGNSAGAASGARAVAGTVAPATSGLPFAQLTACVRP